MGGHMSCYVWAWVGIGSLLMAMVWVWVHFEGKCWALVWSGPEPSHHLNHERPCVEQDESFDILHINAKVDGPFRVKGYGTVCFACSDLHRATKLRVQCVTRCDFHPIPTPHGKGNCTIMNECKESGRNFRKLKVHLRPKTDTKRHVDSTI